MSFTPAEHRYIDLGLPCPCGWGMAIAYFELVVGRRLTYHEAVEALGYNPAIEHTHLRDFFARRSTSPSS